MTQININIRMDEILKNQAKKKSSTKEKNIMEGIVIPPGEENDPFWSEKNIRYVLEGIHAADEGRLTEHELIEV
jgi:hypothetical protein